MDIDGKKTHHHQYENNFLEWNIYGLSLLFWLISKCIFFVTVAEKFTFLLSREKKDVWITRLATYSVDNGVNYIFINALSGSFYKGCFFCYQATTCSTVSFVRFYSPLHINRELNTLYCDLKIKLPPSRNYKIKPKF